MTNKNITSVTIYNVELKYSDFNPSVSSVIKGKPKDLNKFMEINIEDITFFVDKVIYKERDNLSLDIRNCFFMKEIYVKDWDLTK